MVFYGSELMHREETVCYDCTNIKICFFFLHLFILYYIIEFCSLQICPHTFMEIWTYLVF